MNRQIYYGAFLSVGMFFSPDIQANIVGGQQTSGYPGSVALAAIVGNNGQIFCSGTVVAEGWILTAAHCITDAELLEEQYGADLVVADGPNLLNGNVGTMVDWEERVVHPDYDTSQSRDYEHDIALLRVSGAVGQPVNWTSSDFLADMVGTDVTMVGYGWTGDGFYDAGVKRETTVQIDQLLEGIVLTYTSGTNLCNADSGGSGYIEENGELVVAMVPVYVQPRDGADLCNGGATGSVRLDLHRDWLRSIVAPDEAEDTGGDTSELGDEPASEPSDEEEDETKRGCSLVASGSLWLGFLSVVLVAGFRRR